MSAGSKIKDDKQEYQYTIPWVTPGGHEFTFYDTPENERLVIKHSSGSRLEFKADGSVFLTAIKDMHTHASILSSASESAQAADSTKTPLCGSRRRLPSGVPIVCALSIASGVACVQSAAA